MSVAQASDAGGGVALLVVRKNAERSENAAAC
jgi:hypothetical protein